MQHLRRSDDALDQSDVAIRNRCAERERREDLIHDFGNLTVITQPLNSAVSNGPAAQKLPEVAHFAALRLNAYFQSRTSWTEADILERGEKLFEHAKKIWPRP